MNVDDRARCDCDEFLSQDLVEVHHQHDIGCVDAQCRDRIAAIDVSHIEHHRTVAPSKHARRSQLRSTTCQLFDPRAYTAGDLRGHDVETEPHGEPHTRPSDVGHELAQRSAMPGAKAI